MQDCKFNKQELEINGILDNKKFKYFDKRSWHYSLVGNSNGLNFWHDFAQALRLIGYDSILSIEHLDPMISANEGIKRAVKFINMIILREKIGDRTLSS